MALETITAEELVNTPLRSPGWVVEDLIGVGVTLLVGAPKVGKSWLVLRLAECVSRGEPLWGFATCGGTVLDLALEDNLLCLVKPEFRKCARIPFGSGHETLSGLVTPSARLPRSVRWRRRAAPRLPRHAAHPR